MITINAVCDVCGGGKDYSAELGHGVSGVISGDYSEIREKLLCVSCHRKYQKLCAEISAKQKLEWEGVMEKVKDVKLEDKGV